MTTNISPNISATKNGAPKRPEIVVAVTAKDTYTLSQRAVGAFVFTANPTGGTIVIGGTTWTFVSALTTGTQLLIGASLPLTLANAVSTLKASTDTNTVKFLFKMGLGGIELKAAAAGTAGNALTITTSGANAVASGATLAGGAQLIAGLVDSLGPFHKGCALLRAAGPYDNGAWVDFVMPLNNGGTTTQAIMIEQGMKLSTAGYSGDSEA